MTDALDEPLVGRASGVVRVGRWAGPLEDPNIEDAVIPHGLSALEGRPLIGGMAARYARGYRLKVWQYMTIVTDGWFVALAVADAGIAGNGFVYVVNTTTGAVRHKLVLSPLARGVQIARTSTRGGHRLHRPGLDVTVDNLDGGRSVALSARGAFADGGGPFELTAELDSGKGEHLAVNVPLPTGRWGYTHKFSGYTVRGRLRLDGTEVVFDPTRTFGTMDYSKMYALRHAVWRWIAVCGRSTQGAVVGLNLVDPTPVAPVSENGLWVDGHLEPLADVHVEIADPTDVRSRWTGRATGVDLGMRSIGRFEQRLDVPLIRHRLLHVVGGFTGRVQTRAGAVHDLVDVIGIAEDNDTWW